MPIKLTKDQLRLGYDLLTETEPFSRWNMMDSSEIRFVVTRARRTVGYYVFWNGRHEIGISARCVGTVNNLITFMAHEMIHMHQAVTKPRSDTPGVEHNMAFLRLADEVCKHHDFDRHMFADID